MTGFKQKKLGLDRQVGSQKGVGGEKKNSRPREQCETEATTP